MIPRLCEEILKLKDEWISQAQSVSPKSRESLLHTKTEPSFPEDARSSLGHIDQDSSVCPVIRYSSFQERVRSIDPLVSTDFIRIAGNYLQDMGEVTCFTVPICGNIVPYQKCIKFNDIMLYY